MKNLINLSVLSLCLIMIASCNFSNQKNSAPHNMTVGTYQQDDAIRTIATDRPNEVTGDKALASISEASFFIFHHKEDMIISVSEKEEGRLVSFRKEDGSYKETNNLSTEGAYPCYVSIDKTGTLVFVANYGKGVVSMYRIDHDSKITLTDTVTLENPDLSHAHAAVVSPDGTNLFVPDLGNDKIWNFEIDHNKGKLIPHATIPFVSLPKKSGPRHLTFSPDGLFAYLITEFSNEIFVYSYDDNAKTLNQIQQISSLPQDFEGESFGADIHVHPNGKFLYASNRGHNSIAIMEIKKDGTVSSIAYENVSGDWPRNFNLNTDGSLLAVGNQRSDNIVIFEVNAKTGNLKKVSNLQSIEKPACIRF